MRKLSVLILFVVLLLTPTFDVNALMMRESDIPADRLVPIDRIIRNTQAYLDAHPQEARAWYTLGRAHYIAFIYKVDYVSTFPSNELSSNHLNYFAGNEQVILSDVDPLYHEAFLSVTRKHGLTDLAAITSRQLLDLKQEIKEKKEQLKREGWQPPKMDVNKQQYHAAQAVVHLRKAVEIEGQEPLYHLTLASLYKQYLDWIGHEGVETRPKELKDVTLEGTRAIFYQAYSLAAAKDRKAKRYQDTDISRLISVEAGRAYIDLGGKDKQVTWKEKYRIWGIKRHIKKMEKKPLEKSRIVTPIIFSLRPHASLADLLQPAGARAVFDLDGNGVAEDWPWVRHDTGILVWDPEGRGEIASGRQLFGSATWWMMFPHGYAPLDALDDDRDGWLRAGELAGIAAWFDRNANGRSDKGEVVSLQAAGIRAIAARGAKGPGGIWMSAAGLVLSSGRTAPTYDWVARR